MPGKSFKSVTFEDLVALQLSIDERALEGPTVSKWVHGEERPDCNCPRCRVCALAGVVFPPDGSDPPARAVDDMRDAIEEILATPAKAKT